MAEKEVQKNTTGKTLKGTVVSDKMQETVVVAVDRYVKHPKVGKYIKRRKRYHAHNPGNKHKAGETVHIREIKPMSKRKHFEIVEDAK